jgi:superfamily II DNA or RNA helicase
VAGNGKTSMTVMRRREVVLQTQKNYQKYHGHLTSIIMGNDKGYFYKSPHQICSIDTIRTRMLLDNYQYLAESRLFIVDECHDTNSPTYQRMFEWVKGKNPDAIFVGFTATPFTIGGKPLDFWEDYVQPITPQEMRDQEWLVPDLHYAPEAKINTVGLEISAGDFKEKDLFDRASDSVLVGDIVNTWIKIGENRPTIMFCVNKQHSMLMTAAFNMRGISAIHVDESSTADERAQAIQGLRTGKYKIMSNIETMTTGVDAPWVSCLIWGRATWSEVLYCQGIGRGLRPYKICADCGFEYGAEKKCIRCGSGLTSFEKKNCIILDHAANAERHGFAYDPRRAKLKRMMGLEEQKKYTGSKSRVVENPVVRCEKCFVYVKPGQPCTICNEIKKTTDIPKTESGELRLIDEATIQKLKLNQLLSKYQAIRTRVEARGGNTNSVWFTLYKDVGDLLFQSPYKERLGVPIWLEKKIWEQKQKEVYDSPE